MLISSYQILRTFQDLCQIPSFCKLHPYDFFLVIEIFPLRAPHLQVDEVVEVLADLFNVNVGRVYLDLKSKYPRTKDFYCV